MLNYYSDIAFEPSMVVQNISTAACMMILFFNYKLKWKSIWISALHFITLFMVYTISNGIVLSLFILHINWLFISHALITFSYAMLFKEYRIKSKIIMSIAFCAAEFCLIEFAGTIPKNLADVPYGHITEIIFRNLFIILTMLIALYMRYFNMEKPKIVSNMSFLLIVVYNCISEILAITHSYLNDSLDIYGDYFSAVTMLGLVFINLLSYFMVYKICMDQSLNIELLAEKYAAKNDEVMIQMSQKNLDDMRAIRHDIKNQFAYMKLMLNSKQFDQLDKYFKSIEENIIEPLSFIDCGNSNISAVLNLETAKANTQGIKLDTKLAVPSVLPFSDSQICSLLTNLIDNAIEACQHYNQLKATIEVTIFQRQCYLYVSITNPLGSNIDKEQILSLKTNKDDKISHGYGSRIIDRIVRRYNGQVNYSIIDGQFVADIMLDLLWEENNMERCYKE